MQLLADMQSVCVGGVVGGSVKAWVWVVCVRDESCV